MGRLTTNLASDAMDKVEAAAKRSRPPGCNTSNRYYVKGVAYFFEISPREPADKGICGTINKSLPDKGDGQEWFVPVGRFRIDGRGDLVKGPKFFRNAIGS